MRAYIDSYDVRELGPAPSTRQEHTDGSVSYEAAYDVHLKVKVIGNDASEFVKNLRTGTQIKGIEIANRVPPKGIQPQRFNKRHYVFE